MAGYREILRQRSKGISQWCIAASCSCSRNTVALVLNRALAQGVGWPLKDEVTNAHLHQMMFGETALPPLRKRPDYELVHREMAKSDVTLSLLWDEYCEACRHSACCHSPCLSAFEWFFLVLHGGVLG